MKEPIPVPGPSSRNQLPVRGNTDDRAKLIQQGVWHNILQGSTTLHIYQALRTPEQIKFLRVHRTLGKFLPLVFWSDTAMSLARLFDSGNDKNTASLKNLVELALEKEGSRASLEPQIRTIGVRSKELAIVRNKYLAHTDISKWKTSLPDEKMQGMLDEARTFHDAATGFLFPGEHWVHEHGGAKTDAAAFISILEEWGYPRRA